MTITTAQIVALTGLPRATVGRHLNRFPDAKVSRGLYDETDRALSAWLRQAALGAVEGENLAPREIESNDAIVGLPSGVIVARSVWRALRQRSDADALEILDRLIAAWRLRPHHAVQDPLPFRPLALPSGLTVNALQWGLFRGPAASRAGHALDVLLRSWPAEPGERPHRKDSSAC